MYGKLEKELQTLLQRTVDEGKAVGLQAAAAHKGKIVAEAYAGVADSRSGTAVNEHTLFPVFSMTKGMTATLAHLIKQEGKLDYDLPLTVYWPEFGCNGKEKITMRMVLTHTAGLPQVPAAFRSVTDYGDFETYAAELAKLEPLWEPGTECHYHAVTFGNLVCKVLKNITGMMFNELAEHYFGEFRKNECFCGMSREEAETLPIAYLEGEARKEDAVMDNTVPLSREENIARLAIPGWMCPLEDAMNKMEMRMATLPASTGIMTARFVAEMYGKLAHGELLSAATLAEAVKVVPPSERFALGYIATPDGEFGHGGYGGSNVLADPHRDLAVAVLKNRMDGTGIFGEVLALVQDKF